MAYRAHAPTKPKFRKVKKLRGSNIDNVTMDMMASYNHEPWKSIYVNEICEPKEGIPAPGPKIASHGRNANTHETVISKRAKNRRGGPQGSRAQNSNLKQLNDNISVNSFKVRNGSGRGSGRGSGKGGVPSRRRSRNGAQGGQRRDQEFDGMYASGNGGRQGQHQNMRPMGAGESNPYINKALEIDDSEFYRAGWENGRPEANTVLERNFYSILKNHPDMKVKCLEAKYPIQKQSIYKNDFVPMKGQRMPPMQGKKDFRPDTDMDLGTIYKDDYNGPIKFNIEEPMPNDIAPRTGLDSGAEHLKAPTVQDTQYMTDFPNWGAVPPMQSIPPTVPKTLASGMPFCGKQTYKDYGNFATPGKPDKLNPERGQKNPLGVDLPFIGDTTYGNYYRPFKVGKGNKGPKDDDNELAPTKGLYDPVYTDYDGAQNPKDEPRTRGCCTFTTMEKAHMVNDTTSRMYDANNNLLSKVADEAIMRSVIENGPQYHN